jgi:dsRNA-specific ribonuclease
MYYHKMKKKTPCKNFDMISNNTNYNSWFKDGDFKNHILNENNILITENFINKIFKKYNFIHKTQNLNNFQTAMTHVSYLQKNIIKDKTAKLLKDVPPITDENKKKAVPLQTKDYNTFEYYGDPVIHLALTQYLYHRYPTKDSGFLTKLRTKLEKAETLSEISKKIGLDKYVIIARNMEQNNARENDVHLTEDIFESFICALFMESKYDDCKDFIISVIEKELDLADIINTDDNYKDKIMQYFHKMKWKDPIYIENKDAKKNNTNCHDQEFVIYVINPDEKDKILGIGVGNTKIKAQQNAAHNALVKLKNITYDDSESDYFSDSDDNIDKKKESIHDDYFDEYSDDEINSNNEEINWDSWFKDGDFKNHMLNENNIKITSKFINSIFKNYGLKYKITNLKNYQTAMTHVSYLDKITLKEKTAILLKDVPPIENDKKNNTLKLQKNDYGRLAHLGNAVIHMILTEYLCDRYTSKDQGFLTKFRTKLERAETLSLLTKNLGLQNYAVIARNMEQTGSRTNDNNLAKSLFESFIGALSLEKTYDECKQFLISIFEKDIDFAELLESDDNYKEKLMQYFHKNLKGTEPQYNDKIDDTTDPSKEQKEREFIIYITNNENVILGFGSGNTKNKAQQNAAYNVLIKLKVIDECEDNSDYYCELSDSYNNDDSNSDNSENSDDDEYYDDY